MVLFDAAAELFGGGTDVEEEDGAAGVAFGAKRQDDAAPIAGDDADARLLGDAEDPAGDVARLGAQVAVGEEAGVVDKGGALGVGEVALLDGAGGGEAEAKQIWYNPKRCRGATSGADHSGAVGGAEKAEKHCSILGHLAK